MIPQRQIHRQIGVPAMIDEKPLASKVHTWLAWCACADGR